MLGTCGAAISASAPRERMVELRTSLFLSSSFAAMAGMYGAASSVSAVRACKQQREREQHRQRVRVSNKDSV